MTTCARCGREQFWYYGNLLPCGCEKYPVDPLVAAARQLGSLEAQLHDKKCYLRDAAESERKYAAEVEQLIRDCEEARAALLAAARLGTKAT